MRKKLLWLFCIAVMSCVTAAAAGKAELTFEEPLYDFGRVDEGVARLSLYQHGRRAVGDI